MTTIISLSCITIALILLFFLAAIDLKTRLLPNRLVLPFAMTGIAFHVVTNFIHCTPLQIILGGLIGGGFLLAIRAISNHIYKQDTLGLGDVKLMLAAGIWLGSSATLPAISLGAFLGLLHGLIVIAHTKIKHGTPPDLSRLSIPAGPGFIGGIIIVAAIKFFPEILPLTFINLG